MPGAHGSLEFSLSPSNFCREPKYVLVSIHTTSLGSFRRCNWAPWNKPLFRALIRVSICFLFASYNQRDPPIHMRLSRGILKHEWVQIGMPACNKMKPESRGHWISNTLNNTPSSLGVVSLWVLISDALHAGSTDSQQFHAEASSRY